ncbi:Folate-dependent protein for Fe/S cluster synthesis/repair in oxidative stress [Labilithrix luteola]|uniref:Folate-dependent protein for Fe/S cluster synthesis/repair in oxidative stress n=1 Tax=Labilithrix luteola TaxID=1391654 RepID=A0A0K1QAL6_9BACT|nr:glycine cleavage T C-terminal barrel domain-containing protein [Labilithrix luteola]AKV02465.1 Folate-dependent protein for Fe/S cluster synthesis/repair in oxidative stress [Labilithrix luteola]
MHTDNGIQEQARAAHGSVLVVPMADRAAILLTGKDRSSWLNGLVTCDLAKLGSEDGAYGLLVEKKGRIQTDLFVVPGTVSSGEQALAIAVPSAQRDALLATLDHYLIMEDAELGTVELAFYAAHGPRAVELVKSEALAAMRTFGGKVDLLGTGGAVVAVPVENQEAFAAALESEARRLGGLVGDQAGWDAVRIERGLPRLGVEFDGTYYPQEASLEKLAVSFSKGCYLGQEVVYMLENRGHVKRKLVPVEIEGDAAPAAGAAVTTPAGDAIGDVKSAVIGPTTGKPAAIAVVKWAHAKPGTELRIDGRTAHVRG